MSKKKIKIILKKVNKSFKNENPKETKNMLDDNYKLLNGLNYVI